MVAQHHPPTEHDTPDKHRWPLASSVLERRRAARQLDQLLDVDPYPDIAQVYPRPCLREVA